MSTIKLRLLCCKAKLYKGEKCICIDSSPPSFAKRKIIRRFQKNIKGKRYERCNGDACGKEGHWLEKNMYIKPNCKNEPDIYGYEQKKMSSKITFGDWQASVYLFSKLDQKIKYNLLKNDIPRNEFLEIFGSPNIKKNNRYSWSGSCFPKYGEKWNDFGQRILFDENDNLRIYYSFNHDKRKEKKIFPDFIKRHDQITIALWTKEKLETHINRKFGDKGFYILKKNSEGLYTSICFGNPINFEYFRRNIINKTIYLDSGMYYGNSRNYSHFRSNVKNWNDLITEEYS